MSFAARYHGTCPDCGEHIEPGDNVTYRGEAVCHVTCPDDRTSGVLGKQCSRCGLIHPGEC